MNVWCFGLTMFLGYARCSFTHGSQSQHCSMLGHHTACYHCLAETSCGSSPCPFGSQGEDSEPCLCRDGQRRCCESCLTNVSELRPWPWQASAWCYCNSEQPRGAHACSMSMIVLSLRAFTDCPGSSFPPGKGISTALVHRWLA